MHLIPSKGGPIKPVFFGSIVFKTPLVFLAETQVWATKTQPVTDGVASKVMVWTREDMRGPESKREDKLIRRPS